MKQLKFVIIFLLLSFFLGSCQPKESRIRSTYLVEINAMQFQPATLKVEIGDTVRFINKDLLQHNVTELNNKAWQSDTLSTGDTYTRVVAGNEEYFCSLHPVMKGKLLVE